jgi:hypothetical protein
MIRGIELNKHPHGAGKGAKRRSEQLKKQKSSQKSAKGKNHSVVEWRDLKSTQR